MSRNTRTLVVVAVAVALAAMASFGIYRAITRIPVREVEVAHHSAVVARRALPLGTSITKEDVKLIPWPSKSPLMPQKQSGTPPPVSNPPVSARQRAARSSL